MKNLNILKIIILIPVIFSLTGTSYATNPAYSLSARNFVLTNPNSLEFDIYLKHTNPGSDNLAFLNAQYILNFNPLYANGGTLSYSIVNGSSELPLLAQPRSPGVMRDELRLACNAPFHVSNAPVISSVNNGTRIVRMKLVTTASSFAGNLNLRWKNSAGKNFYTKLTAITDSGTLDLTDSSSNQVQTVLPGTINIKLALEGLFDQSTNSLNRKDTVTAYLRNSSSPFQTIDSSRAVIDSLTMSGAFSFTNAQNGTYYLEIIHRNSIETWSKSGGETYIQGGNMNYDFTASNSQSFGNNSKLVGSKYCVYSGDCTRDGCIDVSDMIQIYNDVNNGSEGYVLTDLSGDEMVDVTDLLFAYNNLIDVICKVTP